MKMIRLIGVYLRIGWRNVWRVRRRSFLVMSTALVGMFAVVFMMGWMNGMFDSMMSGAIDTGLGHIQIRDRSYDPTIQISDPLERAEEISRSLRKLDSDTTLSYSRRLEREGMMRIGSHSSGVILMGIEPSRESQISGFARWTVEGEFLSEDMKSQEFIVPIMVGTVAAKKMEVGVGDSIVLTTGQKEGETASVRGMIEGLFESPVQMVNAHSVLMLRHDLSRIYANTPEKVNLFVFRLEDRKKAGYIASKVKEQLSQDNIHGPRVMTYSEMQSQLESLFRISESFMTVLHLIFMTGFALTLLNSILMSIFERTREIGIQRALGAKKNTIILSILFESMILTILGGGVGFLLGAGFVLLTGSTGIDLSSFSEGMAMMGTMSMDVYPFLEITDVFNAMILALGVGLVAGVFPAWKAARMNPVRAINTK